MRRFIVGLTLLAFLGADLLVGGAPASAQPLTPAYGNGAVHTSPHADGGVIPGLGGRQVPQYPQGEVRTQPTPPAPSAVPNVCRPTGGPRVPQTVYRQPGVTPGATGGRPGVTQVAAPQDATGPAVGGQIPPPQEFQGPTPGGVEQEVLSRIEATFNLDPVYRETVLQSQTRLSASSAQPTTARSQSEPLEPQRAQAATQSVALGPHGTPLHQYGYAMFNANVSTFAPVDDIPVGPDYVLGPGDDLTINVWGGVDSTLVRTVDRNGRIVLPKVGDLRVWGLTFAQADRLIREQLARYFRGFNTAVTMGRLRTLRVNVVGEVCQPGVYTLSALATVTNALYSAGGPTKLGSLREVRLLRNGHMVGRLDLYDFLQRGDRTRDYRLESGDTIFVPTIGDVAAVAGEVKRPAIYELRGSARLSDLIELAGGPTPSSYLRRVQIVRSLPSAERVTMDVDVTQYYLKTDLASNPVVSAGDLVLIHRSDPRVYNTVKVEGAVKYPGLYELKPMMRISQLLPSDKLLPEAQPERVEIARRRDDLSMEIVPVNLRKAWTGEAAADVALRPRDEITVRTEMRASRFISLAGEVIRPGTYTIADGERLSSVIARAGGFTERAFLKGAVFTREALRKVEQERLDQFVKVQEQRILASAATTIVGAEKEEVQQSQLALQARRDLLRALAERVVVGRMVVHLDEPAKLAGTPSDLVLADGDVLSIPEPPSSVLVIGAVRTSTGVVWQPGEGLDYYLNRVGGLSREADKKEIHIVKADGSAHSSFTNIRKVDAGDTIIVPPKEEEKIRTLPTIRDVVQTVGSALLGLAAIAVLF